MIDELEPRTRALLDAARAGLSPDPAAVRRVRDRISVATGGAAAGPALGVKLGMIAVIAVIGAIAVGVGLYATRDSSEAVERAPAAVVTRAEEPAPPATASSDDELITIETLDGPASPAPPRPARAERGHRAPVATAKSPVEQARTSPAPARAGIDLAREVELVDLAMAALRRGDATAALDAVRRHAAETAGRGQLAEDAAAIEVEALCQLHDPTTQARLDAFDARFPRSAQRSRLTSTCP